MKHFYLILSILFISQAAQALVLSAYSSYHQGKKIYILIEDGKIQKVSKNSIKDKEDKYLDSDDFVFPGMIDIHNHVQYNVLPLWDNAQGQYDNRFGWRKDPEYKAYVSQAMRVFSEGGRPDMKNNILWAELKSLSSGTTALLGSGGNAYHGKDFGVMNLELLDQYLETSKKVDVRTDIVSESFYQNIYLPFLKQELDAGKSYEQAYKYYLDQSGITSWYERFQKSTRSISSFLDLLFDGQIPEHISSQKVSEENIDIVLDELLTLKLSVKIWDKERTKNDIKDFLFGSRRNDSALESKDTLEIAKAFFALDGNFFYHYSIRDFAYDYQNERNSFIENSQRHEHNHGLVVHLSEGKLSDEFTAKEFDIASKLGFIQNGLVIVHGMGMDYKQLRQAVKKNVSLVWSPYSNLLLYGQSHNMKDVLGSKINLVLGPDWSVTGSKNLLDEIKFAKKYLATQGITLSSQDYVDMVTKNAAKAIGLGSLMGSIKKGQIANLSLISKNNFKNGFDAFVESSQKDINLVMVQGKAIYGDKALLKQLSQSPDKIYLAPTNKGCDYKKYVIHSESFIAIRNNINKKLKSYDGKWGPLKVDPVFKCADPDYAKRTDHFIDNEYLAK